MLNFILVVHTSRQVNPLDQELTVVNLAKPDLSLAAALSMFWLVCLCGHHIWSKSNICHRSLSPKCKLKVRAKTDSSPFFLLQSMTLSHNYLFGTRGKKKESDIETFWPELCFINIFQRANCCRFWLIEPNNLPNLDQINCSVSGLKRNVQVYLPSYGRNLM